MSQEMTSARPYLFRAMHEWISDNSQTPLVVVDAAFDGVAVPPEHVKEGRIVLNIAWSATRNLDMGNDLVSFDARFDGVARTVEFPLDALLGIYSRETGQGMQFGDEMLPQDDAMHQGVGAGSDNDDDDPDGGPDKPGRPNLRIVK